MQWWSLLALADLFVINRPHTKGPAGYRIHRDFARRGWATETSDPNMGLRNPICWYASVAHIGRRRDVAASVSNAATDGKVRVALGQTEDSRKIPRPRVELPYYGTPEALRSTAYMPDRLVQSQLSVAAAFRDAAELSTSAVASNHGTTADSLIATRGGNSRALASPESRSLPSVVV